MIARLIVFYLDDHENLLIATQNGGLNYANLKIKPFVNYLKDKNGKSLADPVVRTICKDKQNKFSIGSEGSGVTVMGKHQQEMCIITLDMKIFRILKLDHYFVIRTEIFG